MTYENIKSIILVLLVCFSVLLTWSIWTYQPNYELMEKPNTIEKVAISARKEVDQIIKPDRILYHYKDDKHLGAIDPTEIDKILSEIRKWNFKDFEDISTQIRNYSNFIHNEGNAVILFPDSIPIELYKTVIDVKDSKLPNFDFDRIVIDVENIQKEVGFVYFISMENRVAYRSRVPASFVHNFQNGTFKNAEFNSNFANYVPFKVNNELTFFLPQDESKMLRHQYYSTPLDFEKFKKALFKDPTVVQKTYLPAGVEYTNGSSLMRVYNDKNILSYINPAEMNESHFMSKNLLKRSIDFVNEHGGWTGSYRFAEMNESNHSVLFRLYDDKGYPIFSEGSGISEISETWGQSQIKQYLRSNFLLGLNINTETMETVLSSGEDVIEALKQMQEIEIGKLQNIVIGYSMKKDAQTRSVYLEPSWYYQYNNQWNQISIDDIGGGLEYGLEQN